ncbi:MAG: hypothetical protein ACK42D_01740 [Candidatus Paceibacteria bacterium]
MKKTTFIILGLVSTILLGVWAYLLFFHTPSEEGGFFADFGWFNNQDITPVQIPPLIDQEVPLVNVQGPRLRQLTTKPVAGYTEIYSTSTEPYFVRYVEAGLGHIYEINMETGEEIRVSNTTVPQAMRAEFSPSGAQVAIQADVTARNLVTVGTITNGEFTSQNLPTTVTDFTFADNGELYYSEVPASGTDTLGIALNLTTNTSRNLFTIPFRAANIGWAKEGRNTHYTYTKPASRLLGYMYSITGSTILRQPVSGNGLNVIANDDFIVYSLRSGETHLSYTYNKNTKEFGTIPILPIPEKCTFSTTQTNVLYCGYEYTFYDYRFPDTWYKGQISLNDTLWRVNIEESSAGQLVIPMQTIGRELDITSMAHSGNTAMLYFINKHDKTLWAYDLVGN